MTAKFPSQKYSHAGAFIADYASAMAKALTPCALAKSIAP